MQPKPNVHVSIKENHRPSYFSTTKNHWVRTRSGASWRSIRPPWGTKESTRALPIINSGLWPRTSRLNMHTKGANKEVEKLPKNAFRAIF